MEAPHAVLTLRERDDEIERIATALDRAAAGSGSTLLVEGERGIGKSALLRTAENLAEERGFRVFEARGSAIESAFPWGGALGAFSRLMREGDTEPLFAGAAEQVRGLLEGTDVIAGGQPPDRWPHLHGLYWLLVNLTAEQPVLFAFDDLHLLDEPSAQLAAFLARRTAEHPMLLIASLRNGEPLGPSVAAFAAESEAIRITPRRLSAEAIGEIAFEHELTLGDAELERLIRASDGVPLFVAQLLAAAKLSSDPGDGSAEDRWDGLIGAHLNARAERLGDGVPALVEAVAVLEDASPEVAFELAGLTGSAGLEALERARRAAILDRDPEGERVRFAHPSLREAVYEDLPRSRRELAHGEAARLLDSLGADPLTVSAHLLRTGPVGEPWAARNLMRAAGRAGADSPEGTIELLERAIREPGLREDAGAHLALGRALLAAGEDAEDALQRAVDLSAPGPARAAARGMLGYGQVLRGNHPAAIAELDASQAELAGAGKKLDRAVDSELILNWFLVTRWVPGIGERSMRAIRESAPPGPPSTGRLVAVGADDVLLGRRDSGLPALRQAYSEQPGGTVAQLVAHALATLGEFDLAAKIAERQLAEARERGELLETVRALDVRVYLNWARGEVAALLADSELELELTERRWYVTTVGVRACRADALLAVGRLEEAVATLDLPDEVVAALPGSWTWAWHPYGEAVVAFGMGDWERARAGAAEAGERLRATSAPTVDLMPWRPLEARSLIRLGEAERARERAERLLELSREQGSRRGEGQALALLGEIEGEAGLGEWARGAELLVAEGAQLLAARELIGLGRALRLARRARDARDPLGRAVDIAARVGATALVNEGTEELRATGAKPRNPERTGVAALTPSEERVCRMVAAGASNREVAERLFVTVRTVETHLTSSYRKLGLKDRSELAAVLTS